MRTITYAGEQLTETQAQGRDNSRTYLLTNETTGTVCEILPVTLEANQVALLRRPFETQAASWLVPHQPGMHPNETVLQHVTAFFGELFEPEASIVHSTSWRYDRQRGQLILTYLVVLPQRAWMSHWAAAGRIYMERIGAIEKVQGDNLFPPQHMQRDAVLAHALDHLALLSRDDRGIQAVLAPEWMGILQMRLPQPAGFVQFPAFEREQVIMSPVSEAKSALTSFTAIFSFLEPLMRAFALVSDILPSIGDRKMKFVNIALK
jgi:hypothetical protein